MAEFYGNTLKTDRNRLIIEMHDKQGLNFTKIGKEFKMKKQAAHQAYWRERKRENNQNKEGKNETKKNHRNP